MINYSKQFVMKDEWYAVVARIYKHVRNVIDVESKSEDALRLRKWSRIMSIQSSTAIEGNMLTAEQVYDIIEGKKVIGPEKDIQEVKNAYNAYNLLDELNPYSVSDFLKAHKAMTSNLIAESGAFRSVPIYVVNRYREVLHTGAKPEKVPKLIEKLFAQLEMAKIHPLIKSSIMHYEIENIHPFRDGNGRVGRLWQTLILKKWKDIFTWIPVETIIHYNQMNYYAALQKSHNETSDISPFIDFMLNVIENSLFKYQDNASTSTVEFLGENAGVIKNIDTAKNADIAGNVENAQNDMLNTIKRDKTLSKIGQNDTLKWILGFMKADRSITAEEIASETNKSVVTIRRYIRELSDAGIVRRVGARKTGHWEVLG